MDWMNDTYTPTMVRHALHNYCDIRSYLTGTAPSGESESGYVATKKTVSADVPLGYSASQSWPFWGKKAATPIRDGKKRGRAVQEMHAAVLDVEMGFARIPREDAVLLMRHFIEGYTVQEMTDLLGYASDRTTRTLIDVAVDHLTAAMNGRSIDVYLS